MRLSYDDYYCYQQLTVFDYSKYNQIRWECISDLIELNYELYN